MFFLHNQPYIYENTGFISLNRKVGYVGNEKKI